MFGLNEVHCLAEAISIHTERMNPEPARDFAMPGVTDLISVAYSCCWSREPHGATVLEFARSLCGSGVF